ncbi:unnamed protein product [Ixodes hexagonus]
MIIDENVICLYDHITPCTGVADNLETIFGYKVSMENSKLRLVPLSMNSLPPEQRHFYDTRVVVNKQTAIQQATLSQDNPTWHSERKLRITGCICRGLYTFEPWDEGECEGKIERLLSGRKFKGNSATAYGKASEPTALEKYQAMTGNVPEKFGLVVNPSVPWLGYSPDAVVMNNGVPARLIEVKSPTRGKTASIRKLVKKGKIPYLVREGKKIALKEAHPFYSQCQLGLLLLNLEVCDFVVFSKVRPAVIQLQRDKVHIRSLVRKLRNVYFKYMLPKLSEMKTGC